MYCNNIVIQCPQLMFIHYTLLFVLHAHRLSSLLLINYYLLTYEDSINLRSSMILPLYYVKLNDHDLLCFHRASYYNEVWGRGSYITFFSPSSNSKRFPMTSLRFTEINKLPTHQILMYILCMIGFFSRSPCSAVCTDVT